MRESVRIRNGAEGKIENEIFRVREKRLAIAVAAPNDLAVAIIDAGDLRNACRRRKRTKGDYFNGQRKRAKGRDDFRGVGNDDHLVRRSRNDLLAQQRAATALDEPQLPIQLVGPVNGQIEMRRVVAIGPGSSEERRVGKEWGGTGSSRWWR